MLMMLTMLHITKLHNNCIKTLPFCSALSKNIKCLLEVDPMYLKGEILPPLDEIIKIAKKLGVTAELLSGLDCVYQKKKVAMN